MSQGVPLQIGVTVTLEELDDVLCWRTLWRCWMEVIDLSGGHSGDECQSRTWIAMSIGGLGKNE